MRHLARTPWVLTAVCRLRTAGSHLRYHYRELRELFRIGAATVLLSGAVGLYGWIAPHVLPAWVERGAKREDSATTKAVAQALSTDLWALFRPSGPEEAMLIKAIQLVREPANSVAFMAVPLCSSPMVQLPCCAALKCCWLASRRGLLPIPCSLLLSVGIGKLLTAW